MNWTPFLVRMRIELMTLALILAVLAFLDPNLKKIPIIGVDLDVEPSSSIFFISILTAYSGTFIHFWIKYYREFNRADLVPTRIHNQIHNLKKFSEKLGETEVMITIPLPDFDILNEKTVNSFKAEIDDAITRLRVAKTMT